MTVETHKHHFQVADIGAWDLDEDRSIVPSINKLIGSKANGFFHALYGLIRLVFILKTYA